jgi:hypothetical protein
MAANAGCKRGAAPSAAADQDAGYVNLVDFAIATSSLAPGTSRSVTHAVDCRPVETTMRKPSLAYHLVVAVLLAGCTRAQFAPVLDPADSAVEVPPDASVEMSFDTSFDISSAEALVCDAPSVKGCQSQPPAGATCDPVCQTGKCAWCEEKCSQAVDGRTVCSARGALGTGSSCTIFLAGDPRQYDNCSAGNICLTPEPGSGLSYCFALCRSSVDCSTGGGCTGRVLAASGATQVLVKVCDPPYRSCAPGSPNPCCDPLGTGSAGCDVGQFCYLVAPDSGSHDNRTVCDYTTGGGGRASQCDSSRDCMQGWTCFGAAAGITGVCRKVCDPKVTNPCGLGGGACGDYGKQYGVCPG